MPIVARLTFGSTWLAKGDPESAIDVLQPNAKENGATLSSRAVLFNMVAGAGFEPATFGL
jgi:hypothetical protein